MILNDQQKRWEYATYLIEAKKAVDSILFISENLSDLRSINVKDKVDDRLRLFYINCRILLDNAFRFRKKERLELCRTDKVLDTVYYEANKNSAHKDPEYQPRNQFKTLGELAEILKLQLQHVRDICGDSLPEEVTLDYVPHDRESYRFINGITFEVEEEMKKKRHPLYGEPGTPIGEPKTVFYSIDQLKEENVDLKTYAVICDNGICLYEGLQNRQGFCILYNILFDQNAWSRINPDYKDEV